MSEINKRPIAKVRPIAEAIVDRLAPLCSRIEIAGSIRRQCDMIGEIEILAIPYLQLNLFGETDSKSTSMLDSYLSSLLDDGSIRHLPKPRWGSRQKSFQFVSSDGTAYQADLFLQTAESWGMNMMFRTGSAVFSKMMVTQKRKGGWLPDDMIVNGARLWRDGVEISTPSESDVFEAIGKPWVEPTARNLQTIERQTE